MKIHDAIALLSGLLLAVACISCGDDPANNGRITSYPSQDAGGSGDDVSDSGTGTDADAAQPSDASLPGEDTDGSTTGGQDSGADMNSPDDAATDPADSGEDGATMDMSFGQTCPGDPGMLMGSCDPVNLTGCSSPKFCTIFIELQGPDAVAVSDCLDSDIHVLERGAACTGDVQERCKPGLQCIKSTGTCEKLCWRDDGQGCASDEFCRLILDVDGIGYCSAACE